MTGLIDLYQLEFIHPLLREVMKDKEQEFGSREITSLYRIGDPRCHGQLPLRAIDEKCKNKKAGDLIARWINERWQYDPDRPKMKVAICHETFDERGRSKGLHLHYQVHPNTRRLT